MAVIEREPAPSTPDSTDGRSVITRVRLLRRGRTISVTLVLAAVAFALFVGTMMFGSFSVSPWQVVLATFGFDTDPGVEYVVRQVRLSTASTALGTGLAMGLAGIIFQRLLANPWPRPTSSASPPVRASSPSAPSWCSTCRARWSPGRARRRAAGGTAGLPPGVARRDHGVPVHPDRHRREPVLPRRLGLRPVARQPVQRSGGDDLARGRRRPGGRYRAAGAVPQPGRRAARGVRHDPPAGRARARRRHGHGARRPRRDHATRADADRGRADRARHGRRRSHGVRRPDRRPDRIAPGRCRQLGPAGGRLRRRQHRARRRPRGPARAARAAADRRRDRRDRRPYLIWLLVSVNREGRGG